MLNGLSVMCVCVVYACACPDAGVCVGYVLSSVSVCIDTVNWLYIILSLIKHMRHVCLGTSHSIQSIVYTNIVYCCRLNPFYVFPAPHILCFFHCDARCQSVSVYFNQQIYKINKQWYASQAGWVLCPIEVRCACMNPYFIMFVHN